MRPHLIDLLCDPATKIATFWRTEDVEELFDYLDNLADAHSFDEVYGQYFGPTMPARSTIQQIAPTERRADEGGHYPDLEQVSLIAVRGKTAQ